MDSNLVLLSVDSLRADYCPWLSESDIETPTLSRLSNNGISYSTAVAPGQATPVSMPAVFTGYNRPEVEAGEGCIEGVVGPHRTIPERLQDRGYETIGFSPNPFTSRNFQFDTGFDYFEDFLDRDSTSLERVRSWIRKNTDKTSAQGLRLMLNMVGRGDITVSWRDYYNEVLEQVQSSREPFFLWIFLLEPHWPYLPSRQNSDKISLLDRFTNIKMSCAVSHVPADADKDRLRRVYQRTLLDVDDFVLQLHEDLEEYNPTYIFHSDHGESLGERGNWGHNGYLFPENVRVPLEVWGVDNGSRISTPISLKQIPNIITSLADGSVDSWEQFCAPTAISRRNETEHTIITENWQHYPAENLTVPSNYREEVNHLYQIKNIKYSEMRHISSAVDSVISNGRV